MTSASPYRAPPVELLTSRRAPIDRAASSTRIVPITLTFESKAGSATERRTSIWAARWNTSSGLTAAKTSDSAAGVRDVGDTKLGTVTNGAI